MYVGRRMSINPVSAAPETTFSQAYKLMHDHDIRQPGSSDVLWIGFPY